MDELTAEATRQRTTGYDASSTTLRELSSARQEQAIARLWRCMASTYGADVWDRRYPADAIPQWISALGAYSLADIARGIDRCKRDDSGRVPTLGQFLALCREYRHVSHAPMPSVEGFLDHASSKSNDVGRRWIAVCRGLLAGRTPSDDDRAEMSRHPVILSDGTKASA